MDSDISEQELSALLADSSSEFEPGSSYSDSDFEVGESDADSDLEAFKNKHKGKNLKQGQKVNKPALNGKLKNEGNNTNHNVALHKINSPGCSSDKKSPKKTKCAVVKNKTKIRKEKPWNKLLDNVVFVISGFQNPLRSDIRSKAMAMGAKYKADWDSTCTHLICAFTNTPKFNQVKGRGKIVRKDWIEECYSKRIRFPWRRYALDKSDLSQPESEEDVFEEIATPSTSIDHRRTLNDSSSEDTEDEIERVRKRRKPVKSPTKQFKTEQIFSSSEDTILKTDQQPVAIKKPVASDCKKMAISETVTIEEHNGSVKAPVLGDCIYDMETEEEEDIDSAEDQIFSNLSDIYENLVFYISENLKPELVAQLKRYIRAHKGKLQNDLTSDVTFIICEHSENIDNIKEKYPALRFIVPEWIWKTHDENKLLASPEFEL